MSVLRRFCSIPPYWFWNCTLLLCLYSHPTIEGCGLIQFQCFFGAFLIWWSPATKEGIRLCGHQMKADELNEIFSALDADGTGPGWDLREAVCWNIEISNPIIQFPFPVVHHRFHLQWLYIFMCAYCISLSLSLCICISAYLFSHCWCRKSPLHRVAGCHYETFNISDWHGHQTGPWEGFWLLAELNHQLCPWLSFWSTGKIRLWSIKDMLDFWFAPEGGHPVAGISLSGYWPDRLDQATRAL